MLNIYSLYPLKPKPKRLNSFTVKTGIYIYVYIGAHKYNHTEEQFLLALLQCINITEQYKESGTKCMQSETKDKCHATFCLQLKHLVLCLYSPKA